MRMGPPPQKAKMLVDLVTGPKLIIWKLTPEEVWELSLPPDEAAKLQNQTLSLTGTIRIQTNGR